MLPQKKNLKITVIVVLVLLAVVLIMQNTESVETKFLFVSFSMPRAVLLLVVLLVGIAVGVILASRIYRQREKSGGKVAPGKEAES